MAQEPAQIRQDIERTRSEMTETVDAIGYKVDVPSRAKEAVQQRKDSIVESVSNVGHNVMDSVSGTSQKMTSQAKEKGGRLQSLMEDNPLGVVIGSIGAGFLIGLLIPTTKVEEEKLGPMASELTDRAREKGGEAIKRAGEQAAGRVSDAVQQQAGKVSEAVEDQVRQQSHELGDRIEHTG